MRKPKTRVKARKASVKRKLRMPFWAQEYQRHMAVLFKEIGVLKNEVDRLSKDLPDLAKKYEEGVNSLRVAVSDAQSMSMEVRSIRTNADYVLAATKERQSGFTITPLVALLARPGRPDRTVVNVHKWKDRDIYGIIDPATNLLLIMEPRGSFRGTEHMKWEELVHIPFPPEKFDG